MNRAKNLCPKWAKCNFKTKVNIIIISMNIDLNLKCKITILFRNQNP